ncbi:3-phosphoshikimate 1-carboxyvinyltransferase [Dermabacter vaginalis]|uniref:3-phosphoshikimate 1-carboxyvinyltransferase n=1 Tax=Dermabacter vaginalis TaxID=1630135 RepID=UPI0021A7A120|nr:3-phosphoshikimate 1-carboxyvinyltransferase [Dermabacter vaginalis]MCT2149592.1 3-phosphoshikimate 1-carboxyvinyltransferase [Dermabacter vaginalis]
MSDVQWTAPVAHGPIDAHVSVPGSKSLTNRWLVLASLSSTSTALVGALSSRDSHLMIEALGALGGSVSTTNEALTVTPLAFPHTRGEGHDALEPIEVHCGLAGTVMRFVPPLAALTGRSVTFTGDKGALVRPMAALIDALRQQGVEVTCHGEEGFLPFTVRGAGLPGGTVSIDASGSSQFVSALLLAAVRADSPLTIRHVGQRLPSLPHIEMSLALLRECGIEAKHKIESGHHEWTVVPGELRLPAPVTVEPDLSNAGPFIAAALVAGGTISIENWPEHTTQPGDEFRRILPLMGAHVERVGSDLEFSGTGPLRGIDVDLAAVGELTPTIAALAALADSPSRLRGIGHLRGHETDRVHALAVELTKLGVSVHEGEDFLEITPGPLTGTVFETYDDHRMATSGAIIGLRVPGVRVVNVQTTNKTLPDFVGMWTSMLHTGRPAGNTW